MVERRGRAERLEVGKVVEYVPPVAEKQQGGGNVGTHFGEKLVVEDRAERSDRNDHEYDGGHEPANAAEPEVLQIDRFRLSPFGYQQSGDQVTGQNEENRDAQKAAFCPREIHVIGDDGEYGECAQAVQGGNVSRFGACHASVLPCFGVCLLPVKTGADALYHQSAKAMGIRAVFPYGRSCRDGRRIALWTGLSTAEHGFGNSQLIRCRFSIEGGRRPRNRACDEPSLARKSPEYYMWKARRRFRRPPLHARCSICPAR